MELITSKSILINLFHSMEMDSEFVRSVELMGAGIGPCSLKLRTTHQVIEMPVLAVERSTPSVTQSKGLWGDLYLFLLKIEEQPVTLTIEENVLKATFEF